MRLYPEQQGEALSTAVNPEPPLSDAGEAAVARLGSLARRSRAAVGRRVQWQNKGATDGGVAVSSG